jgi:phospholipase/carboxylesterase
VMLHGVGSNEQDLFGLAPQLDPRLLIVSARAPVTIGPGQFGWFPVEWTPDGLVGDMAVAEQSRQTLLRFLDELRTTHGIDNQPVYLVGFSQGAIMSLAVALTEPEQVAGVIAMSGRTLAQLEVPTAAPDRLTGLPILVQHGTQDPVLPIEHGRATRDMLSRLPVDLTYREYPMGHHVTPESLADAINWLAARLDTGPRAS